MGLVKGVDCSVEKGKFSSTLLANPPIFFTGASCTYQV